tara:strand:+ start:4182 stop:4523 length:342 start_codon:yes stop_codon:yes gene_type:complete
MSRRDTIDSMTAGETILLAALAQLMERTPVAHNFHAIGALNNIRCWVDVHICQPMHTCSVKSATDVGELCEHGSNTAYDKHAEAVYDAAKNAAYEFAVALDHNLSMEATAIPF